MVCSFGERPERGCGWRLEQRSGVLSCEHHTRSEPAPKKGRRDGVRAGSLLRDRRRCLKLEEQLDHDDLLALEERRVHGQQNVVGEQSTQKELVLRAREKKGHESEEQCSVHLPRPRRMNR